MFREAGRVFFDFRWITAIRQECVLSSARLREKTNLKGNDLIDIIVSLRKDKELCKEIQFENYRVVAQAFTFFVAGFETTSFTMAFTLYELCINPDIQTRLRVEITKSIRENK
ncbi:hypothetical protein NQ318_003757 [Aromia moschata]|uniref:Cytochrome P450 n=1 Tax=Aromia moschata TaxID=1265417 RepID=A0AAV8YIG9_9CUCU|nr:hypothetical protein NQ318_003757 [Aromia moschata]